MKWWLLIVAPFVGLQVGAALQGQILLLIPAIAILLGVYKYYTDRLQRVTIVAYGLSALVCFWYAFWIGGAFWVFNGFLACTNFMLSQRTKGGA